MDNKDKTMGLPELSPSSSKFGKVERKPSPNLIPQKSRLATVAQAAVRFGTAAALATGGEVGLAGVANAASQTPNRVEVLNPSPVMLGDKCVSVPSLKEMQQAGPIRVIVEPVQQSTKVNDGDQTEVSGVEIGFKQHEGSLELEGAEVINKGDKVGLKKGGYYTEVYLPIVNRTHPEGLSLVIYNQKREPNSIDWVEPKDQPSYRDRLHAIRTDILSLSAYPNSFLEDTAVVIGTRPDGVTEIDLGFYLMEGASPTSEEVQNLSIPLFGQELMRIIEGNQYSSDESFQALKPWGFAIKNGEKTAPLEIAIASNAPTTTDSQ